ncbi:hypothetical protein [Geminicoccus roseus]|uniref:hypothetical protein n=1 Tax=Geminicoccus roseus TaxID=404900 RepID=UPI0004157FBA|nr:hypothetical protein [Geminicoccus roseus]
MRRVLALASILCLPLAARAGEDADALLRGLGLKPSGEIVSVDAARSAGGQVSVRLVPAAGAKLVADPGVTVVPVDRLGLPLGAPVTLRDSAQEYFQAPPVLLVEPGGAQALRVEYAYCVVAKQCLFGDVVVAVPPDQPNS